LDGNNSHCLQDCPPIPDTIRLPCSPMPSTRPPTYYTDASHASIATLPLYQEPESDRWSRTSDMRSASTASGRQSWSRP
jgi:hypothetical protein